MQFALLLFMQNKAHWAASFEPSMFGLLLVVSVPTLIGVAQPPSATHHWLEGASVTALAMTLLSCWWGYNWLRVGKNQKAVEDSRLASQERQRIGYAGFAVRLVLFLWTLTATQVSAVWLIQILFRGPALSLSLCLLRGVMVGIITFAGFFVQAVALDRFYRQHP